MKIFVRFFFIASISSSIYSMDEPVGWKGRKRKAPEKTAVTEAEELLFRSAALGNNEGIETALRNARVNCKDKYGYSPLYYAAREGRTRAIKLLLDRGARVDGESDKTPLMVAAEKGHTLVAARLLKADAQVNAQDECHLSPLHYAARGGIAEMVALLLKSQAHVDGDGPHTPLMVATESGHAEIVELLLVAGADVNRVDGKKSPLAIAAQGGHAKILELLFEAGAYADRKMGKLLVETAALGSIDPKDPRPHILTENHVEVIRTLLKHGATLEEDAMTDHALSRALEGRGLIRAVVNGDREIVRTMLGGTTNDQIKAALSYAAGRGEGECTRSLVLRLLENEKAPCFSMEGVARTVRVVMRNPALSYENWKFYARIMATVCLPELVEAIYLPENILTPTTRLERGIHAVRSMLEGPRISAKSISSYKELLTILQKPNIKAQMSLNRALRCIEHHINLFAQKDKKGVPASEWHSVHEHRHDFQILALLLHPPSQPAARIVQGLHDMVDSRPVRVIPNSRLKPDIIKRILFFLMRALMQ